MKKVTLFFMVMLLSVSFATIGFSGGDHAGAHVTKGEVVKIEGAMVTVKDDHGKEHSFHVNSSTHTEGKIEVGAHVDVDSTKDGGGHANSMKVAKKH
ncbi:MAG: hypothetical protein ACE5FY_01865 [Nitrospiria bacterium]